METIPRRSNIHILFIPSNSQGFIFPRQRCSSLQMHLNNISHSYIIYKRHSICIQNAYSTISFILRESLCNTIPTSCHCIKLTLSFQVSSRIDRDCQQFIIFQIRFRYAPDTDAFLIIIQYIFQIQFRYDPDMDVILILIQNVLSYNQGLDLF